MELVAGLTVERAVAWAVVPVVGRPQVRVQVIEAWLYPPLLLQARKSVQPLAVLALQTIKKSCC